MLRKFVLDSLNGRKPNPQIFHSCNSAFMNTKRRLCPCLWQISQAAWSETTNSTSLKINTRVSQEAFSIHIRTDKLRENVMFFLLWDCQELVASKLPHAWPLNYRHQSVQLDPNFNSEIPILNFIEWGFQRKWYCLRSSAKLIRPTLLCRHSMLRMYCNMSRLSVEVEMTWQGHIRDYNAFTLAVYNVLDVHPVKNVNAVRVEIHFRVINDQEEGGPSRRRRRFHLNSPRHYFARLYMMCFSLSVSGFYSFTWW